MTMIAYSRVVWREWFFAYMTVCGAVKFFVVEIYHGYVNNYDSLHYALNL